MFLSGNLYTSFNKYAVKAIRFSAVDFWKNLGADDLKAAIERYELKAKDKPADQIKQLEILLHNLKIPTGLKEKLAYLLLQVWFLYR